MELQFIREKCDRKLEKETSVMNKQLFIAKLQNKWNSVLIPDEFQHNYI
jgi:hypothetical protein